MLFLLSEKPDLWQYLNQPDMLVVIRLHIVKLMVKIFPWHGDLHGHRLKYFDRGDESIVRGWRDIHVTDGDQPYMDKWWVPGLNIGFEHSFTHSC